MAENQQMYPIFFDFNQLTCLDEDVQILQSLSEAISQPNSTPTEPVPTVKENEECKKQIPHFSNIKSNAVKYQKKLETELKTIYFNPFFGDKEFETSVEMCREINSFKNNVNEMRKTYDLHLESIQKFENCCFQLAIPLAEHVISPLSNVDGKDLSAVTPLRLSNALKRKRDDNLEETRRYNLKNKIWENMRPSKSFCFQEWDKRDTAKKDTIVQPLWEACCLLKTDPTIKITQFERSNSYTEFQQMLIDLKLADKNLYETLVRYLNSQGKKRVKWYREVAKGLMDEEEYVKLCHEQNTKSPPRLA